MRTLSTFLFVLLFASTLIFAQDGSRTQMVETSSPVTIDASVDAIFLDDMNGDNTLAGIQARGWVFDDVDGAGTTTVFQGNDAVFASYEGPTIGYMGENYNGAFNGGLLIDQWLISPLVSVTAGDTLKFWHRSPDASTWPDPLQVWVSTTGGTTAAAFDVQLATFNGSTSGWQQYVGNFPTTGNVRFAVRYYTTNGGPGGSQSDYVGFDYFEVIAGSTPPPPPLFFDNFDSYTAGNFVACSNPTFWTTWSNAPCGAEDALVSSDFAYSGTNSAKIITDDDLVKDFGTAYTSGKYKISFQAYIATGKAGYFNTLATFAGSNSSWGMECYFNTTGVCSTFAGSATANTSVSYPHDTWFPVELVVDLDANQATFTVNGIQVVAWQWTLGSSGAGCPLTLDANDFFGATANDVMYMDNYSVEDLNVVPVELTSFAANVTSGKVTLNWITATELNNQGFEVQRRASNDVNFITIGQVNGNGTTTEQKHYSFVDQTAPIGQYYYRLKQIDFDGSFEYSNEVFADITAPVEFSLAQNYPNPFNPTTNIKFSLAEPTFVKLVVYNLLGEVVQTLKDETMNAGEYTVEFDASSIPSGMYLYKIETAQFNSVRKMMLMK